MNPLEILGALALICAGIAGLIYCYSVVSHWIFDWREAREEWDGSQE
jgi:ABC-type long-subunit fatty acid transport system fused permease/ATPase subunit